MSTPSSAQSLGGTNPIDLNALVAAQPGIASFPVSGDQTTLSAPFYASLEQANRAGKTTLGRIIAETHKAKDEAGRAQREKATHTP